MTNEKTLSEKRKEYYKQLWIDLQEGNLTLRQIVDDFIEVSNDLDKEFIKDLEEMFPYDIEKIRKRACDDLIK